MGVGVDTQLDLETFVNIVFNLGNARGVERGDWVLPSYHEDGFIAVKFLPTLDNQRCEKIRVVMSPLF